MKRVLIVEDQADIRKLIRMTLEFEPYEIHEASDGAGGLQKAFEVAPDVMLLDVMFELLWSLADPTDIKEEGVPVQRRPFAAGDALIFYGSCLHGAPGNNTKRHRRGYTRSIISSEVRYTGMPYLKTDSVGLKPGMPFDLPRYPLFALGSQATQ